MRWCVGWQRERLSKKPSTDRRHDSQQRERGEGKEEREEDKRQKKRKTAGRKGKRERNNGAGMPVRKTNEDADLRQNDKTSPRWD